MVKLSQARGEFENHLNDCLRCTVMNHHVTTQSNIALIPSAWKPRHRDDLIRLGSRHDGGYVVTNNIVQNTDLLVGLGMWTDWRFEKDFHKKAGCAVHCYDHTVDFPKFVRTAVTSCIDAFKHPGDVKLHRMLLPLKYKSFFYGNKKHFKEMVGDDPEKYTDCVKIFSRIPASDEVFIKMDIEGWEYRTVHGLMSYYDRITGLVVEFHHVNTMLNTIDKHINDLKECFNIVHVHVNNHGGIDDKGTPHVIEVTFENKNLFPGPDTESGLEYPIKNLDSPNNKDKADYKLEFID